MDGFPHLLEVYVKRSVLVCIVLILLSACSKPTTGVSPLASPLQNQIQSPVMTPVLTATPSLPPLKLDEPLYAGATQVSGTGPAGVPIIIMDISAMSAIGSGEVDEKGEFVVEVSPALVSPNLVGIMFDDARTSPYPKETLPCVGTCRDQPLIGLLFDRVVVKQP